MGKIKQQAHNILSFLKNNFLGESTVGSQSEPNNSSFFSNPFVVILIAGLLLFIPFLGQTHLFDWDEINFAECAREMLETDNYLQVHMAYAPFWEKPPLFLWMQASAMQLFGVTEFAARLPNAICGVATLLFLFYAGKNLVNKQFGYLWSVSYLAGILPHVYFKSGIIDPWFNLFIFSSLYFLIKTQWSNSNNEKPDKIPSSILIAGCFSGLAILTKGPVAFLIIALCIIAYILLSKFRLPVTFLQLFTFATLGGLTASLWFGVEYFNNGSWFIEEFINYQIRLLQTHDAGHKGFPGFHFIVLLLGCFPVSVFALRGFYNNKNTNLKINLFRKWMLILFWVVLILFSVVQSKIIHYSSLCYYPVSFLAAYAIYYYYFQNERLGKTPFILLGFSGLAIGLLFSILPYIGNHVEIIQPLFAKDKFALGNLEAAVNWNIGHSIPGIILLLSTLFSLYFFTKKENQRAIFSIYSGTIIFVFLAYWLIVPNIEAYSQRASILFCKEKAQQDVYFSNIGYKSYAPLFYGKLPPAFAKASQDQNFLLNGKLDKDVYLISRVDRIKNIKLKNGLQEIGRKNGFVFYERKKGK